jgi:hypothetical protein
MKIATQTFSQADTAVILRGKLGDARAWPDFLSDNIRFKQNLFGHMLMPCCRRKGATGYQPRYSLVDILAFVAAVKRDDPFAGPKSMKPITLDVDSSLGWRANKFSRAGLPVALYGARA